MSANCSAAACAAWIRSGSTSVACIDSETSIAIITVAWSRGTRTVAVGWATPTHSTVSASEQQREGQVAAPARAGAGRSLASSATLLNRAT